MVKLITLILNKFDDTQLTVRYDCAFAITWVDRKQTNNIKLNEKTSCQIGS